MKYFLLLSILIILTSCNFKNEINIYKSYCFAYCSKHNGEIILKEQKDNFNNYVSLNCFCNRFSTVINKDNENYEDFKIKFYFIKNISSNNYDFINFYEWYKKISIKNFIN